jgi:hypothetical protein
MLPQFPGRLKRLKSWASARLVSRRTSVMIRAVSVEEESSLSSQTSYAAASPPFKVVRAFDCRQ